MDQKGSVRSGAPPDRAAAEWLALARRPHSAEQCWPDEACRTGEDCFSKEGESDSSNKKTSKGVIHVDLFAAATVLPCNPEQWFNGRAKTAHRTSKLSIP
jgi:hypothetical protein